MPMAVVRIDKILGHNIAAHLQTGDIGIKAATHLGA